MTAWWLRVRLVFAFGLLLTAAWMDSFIYQWQQWRRRNSVSFAGEGETKPIVSPSNNGAGAPRRLEPSAEFKARRAAWDKAIQPRTEEQ